MTHPVLHLDSTVTQEVTVLSNTFIDFYMVRANGEFVKIYLYFLRHSTHAGESITLSGVADALSLTEGDVTRALLYWEQEGLVSLSMQEGQLTGVHLLPITRSGSKPDAAAYAAGTADPEALAMTATEAGTASVKATNAPEAKAAAAGTAAAPNVLTMNTPDIGAAAAPEVCAVAKPEVCTAAAPDALTASAPEMCAAAGSAGSGTDLLITADTGRRQSSKGLPDAKNLSETKGLPDEAPSPAAAGDPLDAGENRSPVREKAARPSWYRNSKKTSRYNQVQPYTQEELLRFQEHTDEDLLFVISRYLGRNLSPTDLNTIVFFEEHLGFSSELIEYLFEFCASNQHYNIHYIETVALNWAENGIDTPAKARSYCSLYHRDAYTILRYLGRDNHTLTPTELEYINRWTKNYGFPLSIIEEACRRAVLRSSPPSLKYTDSILKNWYEQKVGSMEDIRKLDAAHAYGSGSLQAAAGTAADTRSKAGEISGSDTSPASSGDPSGRQAVDLTGSAQASGLAGSKQTSGLAGSKRASGLAGSKQTSDLTGSAQASGLAGSKQASDLTGSKQTSDLTGSAQTSGKSKKRSPAGQPNRFHNFSQRTYDYNQMEDVLLKKYMQTLTDPSADDPSQTDHPV